MRARLGVTLGSPALLLALIHRSAWKGHPRKSISRILHSPTPIRGYRTPAVGELPSEPGLKSTQMYVRRIRGARL